jgi:hypothetical protein
MFAQSKIAPQLKRPALNVIAAPVARLLSLARPQRRVPFYPQEIERFRMELEMKKAANDLTYRFKVL